MLGNDFRFAIRQLRKNPGFVLAATFTLALGVGVNTAVFTLVDGFLLRPLPYPEPDRLGVLMLHQEGISSKSGQFEQDNDDSQDGQTWEMVRAGVPAVQSASFGGTSGVNLEVTSASGADVRYVQNMRVSADYFDVLGIRPFLGRSFTAEEDRPNGPNAVILSYRLWQSALQADHQVLGKALTLKGEPYTVVGILPPQAQTTGVADLWTPLQPHSSGECGGNNCEIIMRLRPGATWQQVSAQLSHLRKDWFDEFAKNSKGRAWFYAAPLARDMSENMRPPVLGLMSAVGVILLIACANLAALTLVRIVRRFPEIATRLALGASRWSIVRQLWAESFVLAFVGAAFGLILARLILSSLHEFLPEYLLPLGGIAIDVRVLSFALLASLLTSLLFGALPALHTRRVDLRSAMASVSPSVARGSSRLRQALIAGEVALTVVLMAAAGLLLRSLVYLKTLPPGFDATNVMTAKASLDDARYREATSFHQLLEHSVAAMRLIPGVEEAAVGLSVPYERGLNDGLKILDGKFAGKEWGSSLAYITPGYFRALHIPILSGRGISDSDTPTSEPVAVVNVDFAHEFYDEPNPVGRHFQTSGHTYTIVGVVADVAKSPGMSSHSAPIATESVMYLSDSQTDQGLVNMAHVWFQPSWIVRTSGPVQGLNAAMQKALTTVDPNLPFSGFHSMQDILAENLVFQRAEVALLSAFGGLALLLSAVGVYGLVSNLVAQRTREIGIRMALGSSIKQAMLDTGASGFMAAIFGVALGLALSFAVLRLLHSAIYGVDQYDPWTLTVVPLILVLISMVASCLPTLRITKIDPARTLRIE
jgi:predicted permease